VQSSTDSERVLRLSHLHGETCYVLLRDYFSNSLYGAALHSKAPPIEWHLQLSQLKLIHALRTIFGEAILRLRLILSLRMRTRTLTLFIRNDL
jgi:hypothetical protein